jgi:hypothetical protein
MEWWSNGVYEITSFKHQITNKSQIPIFNDQNTRQVWNFYFSSTPKALAPVPAKPLYSDLGPSTRFSMLSESVPALARKLRENK